MRLCGTWPACVCRLVCTEAAVELVASALRLDLWRLCACVVSWRVPRIRIFRSPPRMACASTARRTWRM